MKNAELRNTLLAEIHAAADAATPGSLSLNGLVLIGMSMLLETAQPDMMQDVIDFHKKYGIQYDGTKRLLPPEVDIFRNKRLDEEVKEYKEAKTLEEKLDAILDLVYIGMGNLHLHGFTAAQVTEGWKRVQQSNMAKERSSKENPSKYGDSTDIVKPKGWKAPNHSDLCK